MTNYETPPQPSFANLFSTSSSNSTTLPISNSDYFDSSVEEDFTLGDPAFNGKFRGNDSFIPNVNVQRSNEFNFL